MRRWILLSILLLAVILVPFLVLEDTMNAWVNRLVSPDASKPAIFATVVAVLAADVLLPVPSSVVSTGAGALLGFGAGVVSSTFGMTLGCVLAYVCGRTFGLAMVSRMVRPADLEHVSARFRRGAEWALATMRPVPVLAEASTLFAGVTAVPFGRYLMVTSLANAGISAVYCAAGAHALATGSFLLAFGAAIALPGLAWLARGILRSYRRL